MAIGPSSGAEITLEEAQQLIENFKTKFPDQIKASFYGIETLNLILNQEGVMGIRIYYGYDSEVEKIAVVLVGVDNDGKDMTAILVDKGTDCPSECDSSSPLY